MKFKLPKLFKWNIKVSYIIALDNIIHIDFLYQLNYYVILQHSLSYLYVSGLFCIGVIVCKETG